MSGPNPADFGKTTLIRGAAVLPIARLMITVAAGAAPAGKFFPVPVPIACAFDAWEPGFLY
ncbi:hypothetical protein SAMN05421753_11965 [Planctomicrobium piriforme]|uniref:Uncharacterized protein n=1 Tax=Planctomicrobium piriforme TaxID=1576369 RepID=A0A1I3QXB6_9PLAN|nr:hypothetical protein SAMN05421753_11965 [Planctomicrobium piriforme]